MTENTMMALRAYGPYDFRYEQVPIPEPGEGEIRIQVLASGICGADVQKYHGGMRMWREHNEKAKHHKPTTLGHEFYGVVEKLGVGVKGIQLGDHIISEQIIPCHTCKYCLEGNYWMCVNGTVYSASPLSPGSCADYMILKKGANNFILPREMPLEQAVLIEPYSIALHVVERAKIKHTDTVVISGMGPIGLAMASMIKNIYVPKMIIAIELRKARMEKAKEYGADVVLNPLEVDVVKEVMDLTGGLGCTIYIESAGSEKSVEQGLHMIANLGRFVQMGIFPSMVKADWNIIGDTKEIDILGTHLSPNCYAPVIRHMLKGTVETKGMVSHIFPLRDWEKAYQTAKDDPEALKVVLVPDDIYDTR